MLGVLCARPPKPWNLSPHTFSLHHHYYKEEVVPLVFDGGASIWRVTEGGGDWRRDCLRPVAHHHHEQKGEGSWNVAWDARPARWVHRVDLACLLLGVCLCLAPPASLNDTKADVGSDSTDVGVGVGVSVNGGESEEDAATTSSPTYRVTGVPADGRCLFRAIAHGACLQNGEDAPDENRQRELADELRAQVVDELLKRREEIEWFIEGDFDTYVKRIQQPYVWGGEPELLMASHYLKTPILVFMKDRSTGDLTTIANYGEEYQEEKDIPIKVLFHGYGHYDILETSSNQICDEVICKSNV